MHVPDAFSDSVPSHVSTGRLPGKGLVEQLVTDAHARFLPIDQGQVSQVYPALARVPPDLFGICVVAADGQVFSVGDCAYPFTIMSVSKPFVFALVCDLIGATGARERLGVNATGHPFNSVAGIERAAGGRTNPMVNAGAIATTSLVPGETTAEKWTFLHEGLSRFAGRALARQRHHVLRRLLRRILGARRGIRVERRPLVAGAAAQHVAQLEEDHDRRDQEENRAEVEKFHDPAQPIRKAGLFRQAMQRHGVQVSKHIERAAQSFKSKPAMPI